MNSRSRPIRILTLLLLVLQCAFPALVSVADGANARAGRNATAHMEAYGTSECAPAHGADCELCQFLASGLCAPPPVLRLTGVRNAVIASVAPAAGPRATPSVLFDSRAPPSTTA